MVELQIRYVRSADGTNIAYSTLGEGRPLVLSGGPSNLFTLDTEWRIPRVRKAIEKLAERRMFVRADARGRGLSDHDVADRSLEAHVADLLSVVDALPQRPVDLMAGGAGIVSSFAALYPDRVRKVVLSLTAGTGYRQSQLRRKLAELATIDFDFYKDALALQNFGWTEGRIAADQMRDLTFEEMVTGMRISSGWEDTAHLSRVECPVLIVHRSRAELDTPLEDSRRIASVLKRGELRVVEAGGSTMFDEDGHFIQATIEFLDRDEMHQPDNRLPTGTAVIMFTDIADSTAVTEQLGDARFRELSRALDAGLRSAIRDAGGAAIEGKLLGDGVLATFGSAAQAIDGARRCLALSAASELGLHIGLHAGDVIREENNVFGGAVNIAARICGLSAPGEILVSDVVRGMARSSAGVVFEDRGEQDMKGVGEPVRVFAVRGGRLMHEPRVQYCTASDGVNLAFCTEGRGLPYVYMPTFGTVGNLQADWLIPRRRRALEYLTARVQVIQYDRRGQGLSDRDPADDSLAAHVADMRTILDRLSIERVALHAPIFAGPVAITFAEQFPRRVSHLILENTAASMPEAFASATLGRALTALLEIDWELHIEVVARIVAGWSENEVATRVAAQARAANTPEGMQRSWQVVGSWDASGRLSRVAAPVLVVETAGSPFSTKMTRSLAAAIPGAQLRHVDVETGQTTEQVGCEFVTGEAAPRSMAIESLPAGAAVVLFTDIFDSTALTEQLGDAAFRARAARLDAAMRAGIRECGGTPVEGKVLGDGVMAVFTSSRESIDGARRCLAAADATGLALHLGIHAGDVIREENNVFGGAVNIASRICGLSAPGEILVSDVVRGMARSSAGVVFEDRGEQEMKGVGEPVRVYAVRASV